MKIDQKPGTTRRPIRATARSIGAGHAETSRRQWPACPKARAEKVEPAPRKLRLPAVRSMM